MDKSLIYTKEHKPDKDEWYTPKGIVDVFGKFDLDVASNEYNAKRLGIKKYYSIDNSGLDYDWEGKVWCNPPFSLKDEFILKAREQVDKGNADVYMLLPMAMETKIWHNEILGRAEIFVPNYRIAFETPEGRQTKSPAFGSCVVRFRKEPCNTITAVQIERVRYNGK